MSDEIDALIETFVAKLTELGYAPNPGASAVTLDFLEESNGWKFPDAVRRYLLKANGCANGMRGNWSGNGIWQFPPVESWVLDYAGDAMDDCVERGYAGFADALIVAPVYGVCLRGDSFEWGRIAWIDYCGGGFVCLTNFEDFLRAWVADPTESFFDKTTHGGTI